MARLRLGWLAVVCMALFACSASASRLASLTKTIGANPVAPEWPPAFEMEYTVSLPYLQALQPGGLSYPVHVWWDGPWQRYRLDVYGGLDSSGYDSKKGISWNLYPRINVTACDFTNGTSGPTLLGGLLGDGGAAAPLPDIRGWTYAGTAQVGNAQALVWQLSERHGDKTAAYAFYTAPNGWPLRFHMLGVNVLTGSHFDEYIVEFTRFKPRPPPAAAFELPPACKEAAEAAEGRRAGALGSGLAAQLAMLLPAVRMGGAAPTPSEALAALQAAATSAWQRNAALVEAHNTLAGQLEGAAPSPASPRYRLSLNHFAHMSHDQWAATSLGLGSRSSRSGSSTGSSGLTAAKQLWRQRRAVGGGRALGRVYRRRLSDGELPAEVDWRGSGADGPGVKDQVSCGSCWAFGVVGALQGAWWKATGQSLSLSEQQLVDCAWDYGNDGCMGGYIEPTLAYVIDGGGIAQEADYPYLAQNSWCRGPTPTPDANWTTAAATAATAATKSAASFSAKIGGKSKGGNKAAAPLVARFSDFVNVPPRDESALMEAVYLHGPVAVLMNAARVPFKFYSEGVYHNEECGEDPDSMDHVVLLVGYGTTAQGVDYWLIKNSWSKYWGMDGYARITRKGNDCGITTDPVFALVEAAAAEEAQAQAAVAH
ncbi:hypothetical protein CHLRE_08g358522v5 [Chlamydomonas reinhardtii]|uniref:Peptidase C1A papain C-terminal domain-containing protein n=1 Tax=Chlamydomonas reinhardtii TaxID=3055 RepID=A8JID7_CHLRE|nr:uncharacterized protein CHLRE_08g358522v5 [Chlamydomonas reinhardtii]PNW79515.1 hypothetical protein CHLRE_08g358522v5 [Chlamydomonas reinhardtii]|eukprot:XP_001703717.1 cysteine endopeptidase [Chlamydomonas reinhardtii]